MFEPSIYQRDIFHWVTDKAGNAVIDAAAGAGKSTTLVQAAALLPKKKKALFCAFNKHIAEELAEKLKATGARMACRTIHQLGRGALNAALKRRGVLFELSDPNGRKYLRLADDYVVSTLAKEYEDLRDAWYDLLEQDEDDEEKRPFPKFDPALFSGYLGLLVRFRRLTLTDPSEHALRAMALHYDLSIDFKDEMEDVLFWPLLARGVEVVVQAGARDYETRGLIDFTDMIFLPVYLDLPPAMYDWIFVDEAQDLNACQLELVMKACRADGRLLYCGDEHQSMYAFTGADTESMRTIIRRCNATVLPLSRCYRCPTSHIDLARQVYESIEAAPTAGPGIVKLITGDHANQIARARDYFICRTNAPLVTRCFALIRSGVKAVVLGRDLGKNMVDLLKKLSKMPEYSFEALVEVADRYQRKQEEILSRGKEDGNDLAIAALRDKVATLKALRLAYMSGLSDLRDGRMEKFQQFILEFFKPEADEDGKRYDYSSFVVLSTIHKAKGLEADRVFIDRSDLLPHPAAKPGWQSTQERNILYVALTRAKQELYFIDSTPEALTLPKGEPGGLEIAVTSEVVAMAGEVSELLHHDEIAMQKSSVEPVPTSNTVYLAFRGAVEMPLTEGRVSRAVAVEVACPLCSGVCVDPASGSVTITPELIGHTVICNACKRACIVPLNAFSLSQSGPVVAREKPDQAVPNSKIEKKGRAKKERKSKAGRKTKGKGLRQPLQLSLAMRTILAVKSLSITASELFEQLLFQYEPFLDAYNALPDEEEEDEEDEDMGEDLEI
jgi:DNA helicase-2/ATP-dependent DNA helicase PcrA